MANRLDGFAALEFDQDTREDCLDWLTHLESHSPNVLTIDRHCFRQLGLYFEALIAFLFSQGWRDGVVPYRLRERNIQIFDGNITVGELDMLLEDRHGNQIHLECAVKYYLALHPDLQDWRNWVGPNGRDRLDIKLQRLINHQLALITHPAAQQRLDAHGIDAKNIISRYFLRGMFFPHPDSVDCLPTNSNPAALTGHWLRRESFTGRLKDSDNWTALQKLDWLGGGNLKQNQTATLDRLPKMFIRDIGGETLEHLMLVEDYWPDISSPSRRI